MTWQRIEQGYLRQEAPDLVSLWYHDDGTPESGDLLLWLDATGRVMRLQLSHGQAPGGTEQLAEWHGGGALRVGEVDSGEQGRGSGAKMSPLVRYHQQADPRIVASLLAYFRQRAGELEAQHRLFIEAILQQALKQDRDQVSSV